MIFFVMFCKFCNSSKIIKDGKPKGIQRFCCKECGKSFIYQDNRVEYDEKHRQLAIILRTEGNGFRAIARILSEIYGRKIYSQTVQKWLKNYYSKMLEHSENTEQSPIQILELDELYTFVKKKNEKPEFGLLLTATKTRLLRLV